MDTWEQKISVDITVEEIHRITLAQYKNKLKTETHIVPDPFLKVRLDRTVNTRHENVAIFIPYRHRQIP